MQLLGGLGIFLLGVTIMTSGLKGVAGDFLRTALTSFTRSPGSGALTGAISTAILQSSSATTVAAVGFVGAGLLTFPQALGIVFGANVGTTITGWLVALIGFKFKLGSLVLPLILLGILMRLFGRGRLSDAGLALAGFGLIFVGIDTMQAGMSGMENRFMPGFLETDTILGRLKLVLIGIIITLLTQSSSAGVAAALTAVHTGAINFEQAAAMVIGMDIGTTATALFATIGGSVDSRRTGYSHVIYNLLTGLGAFLLLTPYVLLWQWLSPGALETQSEIALVAFHTSFNLLGVMVVLPFSAPFARLLMRLVPDRAAPLVRRLDTQLLKEPAVALEAVRETLNDIAQAMFRYGLAHLRDEGAYDGRLLDEFDSALDRLQDYVDYIHLTPDQGREWHFLMACIHALDHLQRLLRRYRKNPQAWPWRRWPTLRSDRGQVVLVMGELVKAAQEGHWAKVAQRTNTAAATLSQQTDAIRNQIIYRIASGKEGTDQGSVELEAARWLRRVADHIWRIAHHLHEAEKVSYKQASPDTENPALASTS